MISISAAHTHPIHGPRSSFFEWQGLNCLAVENERIRLVFWLDHGADLIEFRHKASDLDVLWKNPYCWPPRRSATGQPHAGRSEFYDLFHGGWFVSVPNGFFPTNYFGATTGCHGELQSVPWKAEILEQSAALVKVRFVGTSERTPWIFLREMILRTGDSHTVWQESLHNRSRERLPAAWLHHPGFGGPFIDGARLLSQARTVLTPPSDRPELNQLVPSFRGPWPEVPATDGTRRDCSLVPSPLSQEEHIVHLTDFPTGWGCLWNDHLKLGFGLQWDEKLFPYAWSWGCGGGTASYPLWGDCHTITLQPSTSPLLPFEELLSANEVLWVDGGSHVATSLSAGFVENPEAGHAPRHWETLRK